jgi:uncharacterized glyoxalase superfamily protein PhnB
MHAWSSETSGSWRPTPLRAPRPGRRGCTISLHTETPEEAERIFGALSEGGKVTMPLEPTFWSPRFGICTDRFGTPWMINCAVPAGQEATAVAG